MHEQYATKLEMKYKALCIFKFTMSLEAQTGKYVVTDNCVRQKKTLTFNALPQHI